MPDMPYGGFPNFYNPMLYSDPNQMNGFFNTYNNIKTLNEKLKELETRIEVLEKKEINNTYEYQTSMNMM